VSRGITFERPTGQDLYNWN